MTGYSIDDVVAMIVHALDASSVVETGRNLTSIQNLNPRLDQYGNSIRDKATLEFSSRFPRAELYGVSPKGDYRKPRCTVKEDLRN